MTEPKFTPGPWFIWREAALKAEGYPRDDIEEDLLYRCSHDIMAGIPTKISRSVLGGCKSVVSIDSDDFDCAEELEARKETLANAHLIAAAPELYEALVQMLEAMVLYEMDVAGEGDVPQRHRDLMRRTRAALAKARGEG